MTVTVTTLDPTSQDTTNIDHTAVCLVSQYWCFQNCEIEYRSGFKRKL